MRLLLHLAAAVTLLGGVGCQLLGQGEPTPTPAPLSILEAAFAADKTAGSYHFEIAMEISLTEGDVIFGFAGQGDFKAPDRVRTSGTKDVRGRAIESETIRIGERTYAIGPAPEDQGADLDAAVFFDEPQDFILAEPSQVQDLTLVGEESLGEVRVYRLTGATRDSPLSEDLGGGTATFQSEFLVGVEDNLLRRITLKGEMSLPGAPAGSGDQATVLSTIDYWTSVAKGEGVWRR